MLEFFCRNCSDYAKMILQELMKNSTQRDLGNISKAEKKKQEGKGNNVAFALGQCKLINVRKIIF